METAMRLVREAIAKARREAPSTASFSSDRHAADARGGVRFAPIASEIRHGSEVTRCANRDRMHRSKTSCYSLTFVGAGERRRRRVRGIRGTGFME
jgi:hypothetical protein